MDRFQSMLALTRVVETGSFSAAARDLRIGQPAVSKAIAALEAQLGARLLIRSTRGLMPSEAGQVFYERAKRALAEADEAWVAAKGAGAGLEGRLRVCAPVTFSRLHIAPRLGSFFAAHPKLRLELIMDDRHVDLVEENIDIALRLGALPDSSMVARKLASAERVLVASPAYLQGRPHPITPSDLSQHEAILYRQGAGNEEWSFRRGGARQSVRMPSRLACTAAEGVREAVLAGLGIAMVSRWMMAPELDSGLVLRLLEGWELPAIDLFAVFPSGRLPSAKARAFAAWFEGVMAMPA